MNAFEFTFLGTCACDYNPELKTSLKNKFDFNTRRSSCAIFNSHYLIDCGDHTLNSLEIVEKDLSEITDIFITHTHSDHFNPESIEKIASKKNLPLNLWVSQNAVIPKINNTKIIKMTRQTKYSVSRDLSVTGITANHDEDSFPQHFLFEKNGKKIFYGCDGAWFLNSSYYFLKDAHLDLCVLDGTCGDYEGDYRIAEHNSIPMIKLMLPSLKVWGTIDDKTLVYISHLAPSLHKTHTETEQALKKYNIRVAYDGLSINIT